MKPKVEILSPQEIELIHRTSIHILEKVGMLIHHDQVRARLAEAGAVVDGKTKRVHLGEAMVLHALESAGRRYILHGREKSQTARFGYGDLNLISSPGQFAWFDHRSGERREPTLQDTRLAARVGDALSNISITGAMTVPVDVPAAVRDVLTSAELVKHSCKPTRCWPVSRQSSHYVLEMYAAIAGGRQALKKMPMVETFLEPSSPLQLPNAGLDILLEFLDYGQPVAVGPMVMAGGTGPATLAGTLAQENAEILAGITTIQVLAPGTPILYGGIPHIMDLRTSICSFGSPEQGLMGLAMAQIGKSYGLPVYINVNLSDSKSLDVQAGMEKMGSLVLGALAGADLFGHAGILGTDHGGSLSWLVVDHEALQYARRVVRGFTVDAETLAEEVVARVGPAGNFLSQAHTMRHFKDELWMPDKTWTRETYDGWKLEATSMADRAAARVEQILREHQVEPLDPVLEKEIDRIARTATRELIG